MSEQEIEQEEQVIACNPGAIPESERDAHGELAMSIFSASSILEVEELESGYAFRVSLDTTMLEKVAKWIANERLCCPFFTFTVVVRDELWIQLSGRPTVKEMIKLEILPMIESGEAPTFDELQAVYDEKTS